MAPGSLAKSSAAGPGKKAFEATHYTHGTLQELNYLAGRLSGPQKAKDQTAAIRQQSHAKYMRRFCLQKSWQNLLGTTNEVSASVCRGRHLRATHFLPRALQALDRAVPVLSAWAHQTSRALAQHTSQ